MEKRSISFGLAMIPVVFLVVALILTLRFWNGAPHMALLAAAIVAAVTAKAAGCSWNELEAGIVDMLTKTLPSMLIFCIIGIVIGIWMLAGIVPAMIYYGLQMISPKIFLVTACLISAVVSLATGSSWTTVGTVGIALIGMGHGMGVPPGVLAGAIVSGAYFGDKMSPLSDTTNLAPAAAGSTLFEHIIHMIFTSGPSLIIALILYGALGLRYSGSALDTSEVMLMLDALGKQFVISPVLFIPPIFVIAIVIMRVPAIPGLIGGALAGAVLAFTVQGSSMTEIISAAHYGYSSSTGIEVVDSLLTRGGLSSMMWSLSLVFMSLSFAGIMERSGMVGVVAQKILSLTRSTGDLILSTVLTCIGVNVLTGDQYLSIVFTGEMYKKAYKMKGLAPKNLSRTLEDSGTLTSPLVPWNACAVFMASTLGVATTAYLPFTFFNLLCPIIAIFYGYTGLAIAKVSGEDAAGVERPAV